MGLCKLLSKILTNYFSFKWKNKDKASEEALSIYKHHKTLDTACQAIANDGEKKKYFSGEMTWKEMEPWMKELRDEIKKTSSDPVRVFGINP